VGHTRRQVAQAREQRRQRLGGAAQATADDEVPAAAGGVAAVTVSRPRDAQRVIDAQVPYLREVGAVIASPKPISKMPKTVP
jgi:hypothetical protein